MPAASAPRRAGSPPGRRPVGVVIRLLLLAAVVALAAGGLGAVHPTPGGSAAGAVTSETRPAAAAGLRWRSCGAGLECATLTVPVDHADPTGPTVGLAVIRQPARDPQARIGSLVVDPGGPGGSGVDYVRQAIWAMDPTVRDRFDVVGFDPRGTGASRAVDCGYDMDRYYDLEATPRDDAGWDALVRGSADYAAACAVAQGDWLTRVGTDETVRDLDLLRAALGDDRLTYLGYSYGTLIGSEYAAAFPERVRALVLDGPIDPALPAAESQFAQAVGFETVLDNFLRWCDRRSCAFGRGSASTGAALTALDAKVRRAGLPVGPGPRTLSHTEFQIGISTALYGGRPEFPALAAALAASAAGDGTDLADLADAYTQRSPSGVYGTIQDGFFAVSCLDGPPIGTVDDVRALYDRTALAAPRLGAGIVSNALVCAQWPVAARSDGPPAVPPGLGILVVGTTQDPATPYSGAVALAERLDAPLLTVDGDAHTAFDAGIPCVDDRVVRFLLTARRPAHDLRCA